MFTNTVGNVNGKHFSGWCFMIARDLWKRMGGFDDCVSFWCSDDVVIAQAQQLDVTPMIVPNAHVDHLQSQTLNTTPQRDDLTWAQLDIYINKYGPHPLQNDHRYLTWKQCSA
jgi:GT2 family glycosyltransferase